MSDHKRLTVDEAIRAMLAGKVLTSVSRGEIIFDPSYSFPFRFRIRTVAGNLANSTHPLRSFHDGEMWIKETLEDDPADWMERPEYVRAKLWMERCEAARLECAELRFRLNKLEQSLKEPLKCATLP